MGKIIIVIVILGIVVKLIIDAAVRQWQSAMGVPCRLITAWVLQDVCAGTCPPGQACATITTRSYGQWGWLGTQAASCNCIATPPATGTTTPGEGGGNDTTYTEGNH